MALPWQSSPGFISTHINTFIYVNMLLGAVADMVTALFLCPLPYYVNKNAIHTWLRNTRGHGAAGASPGGRRDRDMSNPRQANGTLRRKHRARFKAMNSPCGICKGRLGPIHYDEPSDAQHPLSFVIDEIRPVSRWKQFGYDSAKACAQDWNNLQAAHYCCNQAKGNKVHFGKLAQAPSVSMDW